MWAKIINIKKKQRLKLLQSVCNEFNTRVSQFELNYWNKWNFPQHSNLLRYTCMTSFICKRITVHNCIDSCLRNTAAGTFKTVLKYQVWLCLDYFTLKQIAAQNRMSLTSDVLVWRTISLSEMASTSKLSLDDWAAILLWLGMKLTWINRNVRKCLLCVKRQCISMSYNQYILLVEGSLFFFFFTNSTKSC